MEFNCELCNKQYKNNSSLWKHNKKFHPKLNKQENNEDKDYECKYCHKKYTNRNSKYKHQTKSIIICNSWTRWQEQQDLMSMRNSLETIAHNTYRQPNPYAKLGYKSEADYTASIFGRKR